MYRLLCCSKFRVASVLGSVVFAAALWAADGKIAEKPQDRNGEPLPHGARARLGTTHWRHGSAITFVAFLPDGKSVLSAGDDDTIRLWDYDSGKEIRRYAWPAVEEKGSGSASGSEPKAMRPAMMVMGGAAESVRFALSPDGKLLAACSQQSVVQLWEVATGKPLRRIGPIPEQLEAMVFSPDSKALAGRGADTTTYLWEAASGKEIRQIKDSAKPVDNGVIALFRGAGGPRACLAFAPDGKVLACGESEQDKGQMNAFVKLVSISDGKEIRRFKLDQNGSAAIAYSPDGKLLAYSSGNSIHLCEPDTGKEVRQLKGAAGAGELLVFSPDGKTLASRSNNGVLKLWDVEKGAEVRQLAVTVPESSGLAFFILGFGPAADRDIAFAPDGKVLAAGGGNALRFWTVETGKELVRSTGHFGPVTAVHMVADGKTVISRGSDNVIRRWAMDTGKELGRFDAPSGSTGIAVSRDGSTVALGNRDNSVRLHDTATGKELHKLNTPNGVVALAFSSDGKLLAVRGSQGSGVRLFEVISGKELKPLKDEAEVKPEGQGSAVFVFGGDGGARPALVFSGDGRMLALLSAKQSAQPTPDQRDAATIELYDLATGKARKIALPPERQIRSLSFSPDGRTLAAECNDGTISVWEVASGKERMHLGKPAVAKQGNGTAMAFVVVGGPVGPGTPAAPSGVVYSPDGRLLAARWGKVIQVWDADGNEIEKLEGHQGDVTTIAFSSDGKTLASGSNDTTMLLWNVPRPAADGRTTESSSPKLESLWADLADADAAKAHKAIARLAAAPEQSLGLLKNRLKPAEPVAAKTLAKLIADLDSEDFDERQKATEALERLGELAVPSLTKLLSEKPPLEIAKRAEDLLQKTVGRFLIGDRLRMVRCVEVLERLKSAEARQVLEKLATGAPGALPTREAQASLERMK